MAEINDAYAALIREADARSATVRGEPADFGPDAPARGAGRRGRRPTRPVTGRVDTTTTFRPRNQTTDRGRSAARLGGRAAPLRGQPRCAANASDRSRRAPRRRPGRWSAAGSAISGGPQPPSLDARPRAPIEFGKFHGHTLGQIAAFEPSYIDWVAGTVTRDPELVAAARVVQADLDARGVAAPRPPAARRRGRDAVAHGRCVPARRRADRPPDTGGRSMR